MSTESIPQFPSTSATWVEEPSASLRAYFEFDRASDKRNEYIDGEIIAMSGESPAHNEITGNIYYRLRIAFESRRCRVFMEGVRTRVTATRYRYPDIAAVCDEALFDDQNPPSLLNPSMIVEVLSESTASNDRHEKFVEYKNLATLTDYLLVSQDSVEVTHYVRQTTSQWLVTTYRDISQSVTLASLGVSLTVAQIYSKTQFSPIGGSI